MPSKQKNEGKEILSLDFDLFIGGIKMPLLMRSQVTRPILKLLQKF